MTKIDKFKLREVIRYYFENPPEFDPNGENFISYLWLRGYKIVPIEET